VGAAVEEERQRSGSARVRAEEEARRCALKRKKGDETVDGSVEKELRSAFQGLTGRAPRLTGRAVEASGQSPVRSFSDWTRPFRGDRTQTESDQRST
jgi:hypothetical protein